MKKQILVLVMVYGDRLECSRLPVVLKFIAENNQNTQVAVVKVGQKSVHWDALKSSLLADNWQVYDDDFSWSKGVNRALGDFSGSYVLFTTPLVNLQKFTVRDLSYYLEQEESVAIVAPVLVSEQGELYHVYRRFPRPLDLFLKRSFLGKLPLLRTHVQRYLANAEVQEITPLVDWVIKACMMVRVADLHQVGLFDERFKLFFADTDLCYRLWLTGRKVVYISNIKVGYYDNMPSAGGLWAILFNKMLRVHITDAMHYFLGRRWGSPRLEYLSQLKK